jgi:hypothetical protein
MILRLIGFVKPFTSIVNFVVKRHRVGVLGVLGKDTDSHKQLEDREEQPGCEEIPCHSVGSVNFFKKLRSLLQDMYNFTNKILFQNCIIFSLFIKIYFKKSSLASVTIILF